MAGRQTGGGHEWRTVGRAARVLAPCHFTGILVQIRTGDVMVLTDFSAAEAGEIAFRLIGAGTIHAVGATVIDPPHLIPRVQVVPTTGLDGVNGAAPGNTLSDDRHGLGFSRRDD